MRTTISLPDPVFENAKHAAQTRGISLSEYIHEALIAALNPPHNGTIKPFLLLTEKGGFKPGLDMNRTSELLTMDDEEKYGRR
jgi:hypothetical protein